MTTIKEMIVATKREYVDGIRRATAQSIVAVQSIKDPNRRSKALALAEQIQARAHDLNMATRGAKSSEIER